MAAKKRGRAKGKGPALKAWLGEGTKAPEGEAETAEAAPEEPGETGDADASGDVAPGDATGGAVRETEEPAEEPESEESDAKGDDSDAKGDDSDAKGDDSDAKGDEKEDKKPDEPKEKISASVAAVRRREKAVMKRESQVTEFAQTAQTALNEARDRQAEAEAIIAEAKSNPVAFVQKHGGRARDILNAAAQEEELTPEQIALREAEAKYAALEAEVKAMKDGQQKQQAHHDEAGEVRELAYFLENPPDGVDVSGIQWWGSEQVARDLHRAWVDSGRQLDLRSEIEKANTFFSERLSRVPSNGRPEPDGAVQSAKSEASPGGDAVKPAKAPPPALSNATARRPTTGPKKTRKERKQAAIDLLEARD